MDKVDIWFQDEARVGQQGSLTRVWSPKGTRMRLTRQQQFLNAYIFGAVSPSTGEGAAVILPTANTASMKVHLEEISIHVPNGRHAVIIMDQARWHTSKHLHVPSNISLLPLPPYSPELNPQENIWRFLRENSFANRTFNSLEEIIDCCCSAWNNLMRTPEIVKSISSRQWADINMVN